MNILTLHFKLWAHFLPSYKQVSLAIGTLGLSEALTAGRDIATWLSYFSSHWLHLPLPCHSLQPVPFYWNHTPLTLGKHLEWWPWLLRTCLKHTLAQRDTDVVRALTTQPLLRPSWTFRESISWWSSYLFHCSFRFSSELLPYPPCNSSFYSFILSCLFFGLHITSEISSISKVSKITFMHINANLFLQSWLKSQHHALSYMG